MIFDIKKAQTDLGQAITNDSEVELLKVLKENSFLFYDLYERKWGIQPNFCEVAFGNDYRCDFCWLNDSSHGPEWVLVEVEKPKMKLFKKNNEPTAELNHAIEQVKSWERYFSQKSNEKSRIFGAVSKFRLILVAGESSDWQTHEASSWRSHHNATSSIEIRSINTFTKSSKLYKENTEHLSFEQYPKSLKPSKLNEYCRNSDYIKRWKHILN